MAQQNRRSDDTWDALRLDWEAGYTRSSLAERYRVGESTIRDRIHREGWRRSEQAVPPPPLDGASELFDADRSMRPPVIVAAEAYRRADQAMRRGRTVEAERLMRIARGFERLIARDDAVSEALDQQWDREAELAELQAAPPWPDGVDSVADAHADLDALRREFDALRTAPRPDMARLHALLDRDRRLRWCLELAADHVEGLDAMAEATRRPGDPPIPPDPPAHLQGADLPPPPALEWKSARLNRARHGYRNVKPVTACSRAVNVSPVYDGKRQAGPPHREDPPASPGASPP